MDAKVKENYFMGTSIYGRNEFVPSKKASNKYDPELEVETLKEKALEAKQVGFFNLFRYANACDILLMTIGVFFALLSGVLFPVLVYTIGIFYVYAYDVMFTCDITQDHDYFYRMFGLHCSLGYLFTSFAYHCCFMWAAKRQLFRIRIAYMESIIRKDFAFFDTYIDRDLALRMTHDITEVRYGLGENVPKMIFYSTASVLLIIMAIVVDHQLAAITIICIPLVALIAYLRMQASATLSRREQKVYGQADSVAAEILSCIKAVKLFQGENKELSRYRKALYSPLRLWKVILVTASASGAMWLVACLHAVIFLSFILYFEQDSFDQGPICKVAHKVWWNVRDSAGHFCRLVIIFLCVLFASIHCANIPQLIQKVKTARQIGAEIFFTIDWVPRIDNLSDTGEKPRKQAIGKLEMIKTNFRYPRNPAIKVLTDATFTIYPGQMVTFFGPKDSGKSTVIRLLLRLYDVCSGKVKLDGINVERLHVGWLRSQFGVISKDSMLFNATIEENIRFGKESATFDDVVTVCKKSGVHSDIMSFPDGYQTKVGFKSTTKLTDIVGKKISLARVLLQNPRIFILDHVIGDVNQDFELFLLQLLEEYREKCTIVLSSHKCNTLVKNSDVIFVMKNGRIVEMGNHELLFSKEGIYYSMLQETLEQDFDQKPYFTSQLTSYKFAEAIARKHVIHDRKNSTFDEDWTRLLKDESLFESTFLRHTDPNSPYRLIQSKVIGGFQRYQYYTNVQTDIHLRLKLSQHGHYQDITTSSTPMSTGSLSPVPTSEQLVKVTNVSPAKMRWKVAIYNTLMRKSQENDKISSSDSKKLHDHLKMVHIQDDMTKIDDQLKDVSKLVAHKDSHVQVKKKGSHDWNMLGMVEDEKLQYYLGWTINSSPDEESIASDDSFFFWDSYNRNVQLAALTLGRKIDASMRGLFYLMKFSWPYLFVGSVTSFAIGLCCCGMMWQESQLFPSYIEFLKKARNLSNLTNTPPMKSVSRHSNQETFVNNCKFIIIFSVVAALLAFIQECVLGIGNSISNNNMRKKLFSDLLQQDLQWFDYPQNDIGFLCNSLAADTACVQMALQAGFTVMAQCLSMGIVALFIFCWSTRFHPEVFYMLPLIPVTILIGYFEESMLGKYNSTVGEALKRPTEIQYQIITQMRDVIMLNLEGHFLKEYLGSLKSDYGTTIRLFSIWRPLGYGLSAAAYFLLFHTWFHISWTKLKKELITDRRVKPEIIGSFYLIGDLFMTGFFQMGCALASLPNIKNTLAAAELILSCRKKTRQKQVQERSRHSLKLPPQDPPPEIQLHKVDFAFPVTPDVFMLKQVGFKIESQKYVAIVGPVKSGKSALVGILLNLYFPTSGALTIGDKNFKDVSDKSLRSIFSVVEQDPTFLNLTLGENIAYGDNKRLVGLEEVQEAAKLANIHDIIEDMKNKYDTKISDLLEGPETFVLRQRLAVARVVINNPKILIVDEATTSIDNKNNQLLYESLLSLRKGRTFIVISQRIEPIRGADLIVVLQNGRVAEMGSDSDLMARKESYYEIFMSQKLFERNPSHPDWRRSHL